MRVRNSEVEVFECFGVVRVLFKKSLLEIVGAKRNRVVNKVMETVDLVLQVASPSLEK